MQIVIFECCICVKKQEKCNNSCLVRFVKKKKNVKKVNKKVYTYFVYPKRLLFKVPIRIKLVMHERVPAVRVHIAGLLCSKITWSKTADLGPCEKKNDVSFNNFWQCKEFAVRVCVKHYMFCANTYIHILAVCSLRTFFPWHTFSHGNKMETCLKEIRWLCVFFPPLHVLYF